MTPTGHVQHHQHQHQHQQQSHYPNGPPMLQRAQSWGCTNPMQQNHHHQQQQMQQNHHQQGYGRHRPSHQGNRHQPGHHQQRQRRNHRFNNYHQQQIRDRYPDNWQFRQRAPRHYRLAGQQAAHQANRCHGNTQRALSNPSSPTSLSRAQSFDFRDEVKALEINYAIPSPSPENVDVDHEMPPHSAPSPSKIRKKEKRILRKDVAFNELALQEEGDETAAKRLSFEIMPGSEDKE